MEGYRGDLAGADRAVLLLCGAKTMAAGRGLSTKPDARQAHCRCIATI